ncbi:hypothetical protein GCM10027341_33140 [Spirosoma knui]
MRDKIWVTTVPDFFVKYMSTEKLYLVEQDDNNKAYIIREATASEYESILAANKVMFEYHYFNRRSVEIDMNLNDFLDTCQKYSTISASSQDPEYENSKMMDDFFVNINRTFTSYVSSCRIFIDHLEFKLKRKYGSTSKEYLDFDKAKKYCYNSYFSYKLFYHLRNYALHEHFPINNIYKGIEYGDSRSQQKLIINYEIYFDTNALLSSDDISKKLKLDLKRRNNLFPVLPVVNEFKKALDYLLKTLLLIEKTSYVENANILMRFLNTAQYGGKVEIGKFTKNRDNTISYSPTTPNVTIIENLRNNLRRLNV